jgi:hypothetical protein
MWNLVIVNDKLKMMWKDKFVACFNVLSQYLERLRKTAFKIAGLLIIVETQRPC